MRIRDGEHPLDASSVHPERYQLVDKMAEDLGCTVGDLMRDSARRGKIDPKRYVSAEIGLPTLQDILSELSKPGRDPRQQFEAFSFAEGVEKVEHLQPGMRLPGVVTNVTAFGAFVDVGVHQDGLVHISQLSDDFVKDPAAVVKVGQRVQATVMEVDLQRKRIALSLKTNPEVGPRAPRGGAEGGTRGPGGPGNGGASQGPRRDGVSRPDNRRGGGAPAVDWFTAATQKKR